MAFRVHRVCTEIRRTVRQLHRRCYRRKALRRLQTAIRGYDGLRPSKRGQEIQDVSWYGQRVMREVPCPVRSLRLTKPSPIYPTS
jgi:hypothetical protein